MATEPLTELMVDLRNVSTLSKVSVVNHMGVINEIIYPLMRRVGIEVTNVWWNHHLERGGASFEPRGRLVFKIGHYRGTSKGPNGLVMAPEIDGKWTLEFDADGQYKKVMQWSLGGAQHRKVPDMTSLGMGRKQVAGSAPSPGPARAWTNTSEEQPLPPGWVAQKYNCVSHCTNRFKASGLFAYTMCKTGYISHIHLPTPQGTWYKSKNDKVALHKIMVQILGMAPGVSTRMTSCVESSVGLNNRVETLAQIPPWQKFGPHKWR
jgi:hypothetical protein